MSGKRRGALLARTGATLFELGALGLVVLGSGAAWMALGAGLHVGASWLARVGARRRRPDLSVVEADVVFCTAFFVPLFGPVLGASLPRPAEEEEAQNAHAVFEQYSEHVHPARADYERTLFTGDYARDLARELDAESYHSVLRHGSTDQKRNALRRLAELGGSKHFDLIRSCLLDESHEVRLYAYSELERSGRIYEEEIAKRSRELANDAGDPEALIAMARAYLGYAVSGIQDRQMAAFYFRSAESYAADAARNGHEPPEPTLIQAAALGKLDEYDTALERLAGLSEEQQGRPEACLVRAELAYRRRDFATVREETQRMQQGGTEPPAWLAAIGGTR